jgi:hypothetical protein
VPSERARGRFDSKVLIDVQKGSSCQTVRRGKWAADALWWVQSGLNQRMGKVTNGPQRKAVGRLRPGTVRVGIVRRQHVPVRTRIPQKAAYPNAGRNPALTMRPLIVLLLQPWSTATSQTRKKSTATRARLLIHIVAPTTSLPRGFFSRKDAGHVGR